MFRRSARIRFLCRAEDVGVIAEPVPARSMMPAWFRQLPGVDRAQVSATNNGLTVKRCMPFLDAMSIGWIIPLAATVRLEIRDGGQTVDAGWEFDRPMVSNHGPSQIAGSPFGPGPPMKFHNHWAIRTPAGWSCLFLPPINRPNDIFEVLGGMVDTDRYTAPVNLPFVTTATEGVHTIEKGTPLVQVIPVRRADAVIEGSIRPERRREAAERERIRRSTLAAEGWYRRHARASR